MTADSRMKNRMNSSPVATSPVAAEWRLILACAHTRLSDLHRERIRQLLQTPLDWTRITTMASQHCVDGLLQRSLSYEAAGVPHEVLTALRETASQRTHWCCLLYTSDAADERSS